MTAAATYNPTSMASQVAALEPGQSVIFNTPEDERTRVAQLPGVVFASRDTMRNRVSSAIRGAKSREECANAQYSQEVQHLLTTNGRVLIISIVTRIE